MDFLGSGVSQKLYYSLARCSSYYGVVNKNDPLSVYRLGNGIKFYFDLVFP